MTAVHCRLMPGVGWRELRGRHLLVRTSPLTAVEVTEASLDLLPRRFGETLTLSRPSPTQRRFLRRLADLGLVQLVAANPEWPPVTVVVPTRDRPQQLRSCLESLARLRYPPERLELIVVDDGSAVPVVDTSLPGRVRLLRLPVSHGPAEARNRGAQMARGALLAFVDSDCQVEPDWLSELVREFDDPSLAATCGRVLATSQAGWLGAYEAVRSPLDLGPLAAAAQPAGPVPYLVTTNLVVRRSVFEAVGGFARELRFGEDVDFSWRLFAAGHRLLYQPRARVRHDHRLRLGAFVRTRAQYAASEAVLLRRHPIGRRYLALSPALAVGLLGALGWATGRGLGRLGAWLLLGGTVGSVLEAVTGTLATKSAHGLPASLLLPATARGYLACLYHLARQSGRYYGLPALAAVLWRPRLGLLLAGGLLGVGLSDWVRLKPHLSPLRFLLAQALDDLAYQGGCLWGCLRQRTLKPLLVELRIGWPGRGFTLFPRRRSRVPSPDPPLNLAPGCQPPRGDAFDAGGG